MEPEGSLPHLKVPPPVPNLSHIDQFHDFTSHFLRIHLNIILPCKPGYSKRSLSLRLLYQNPIHTSTLPNTYYMPHPPIFSRIDHSSNIWWRVEILYILIYKLNCLMIARFLHPRFFKRNNDELMTCDRLMNMAYSLYVRWNNFLLLTVMTLHELKGYQSVGECRTGQWSLGST